MDGCEAEWWVSGGMAVELVVGRTLRSHGDVDISVTGPDLVEVLAHLSDLTAWAAVGGHLVRLREYDAATPVHNIWLGDRAGREFVLQVNVESRSGDLWVYRRCPSVTLPWDALVQVVDGLPTGSLAAQLLWKAKAPEPKDHVDLRAALPVLDGHGRAWLGSAVAEAHPESPWRDLV